MRLAGSTRLSAPASVQDPSAAALADQAARKTILLLRDDAGLLPLAADQKVLLVEQVFPTHRTVNDLDCHPGLLWEEMCRLSGNVCSVEIGEAPSEDDARRVMRRLGEAETVVATNYYYHKAATTGSDSIRRIVQAGKKVIVVTNTPYEFGAPRDLPTVIVVFHPGAREHLRAAAQVLYGKLTPAARPPVRT